MFNPECQQQYLWLATENSEPQSENIPEQAFREILLAEGETPIKSHTASHLSPRGLQDLPNIARILNATGIGCDHKVVDDMLGNIG